MTTTIPMLFRIPISKINDVVEIDLGACPASSQHYNHFNGLKQRFNDCHSAITVKSHPDPVERAAAVRKALETVRQQYLTGTCPAVDVVDETVIAAVQMMNAVIGLPEPTRETVIATLPVAVQTAIRARLAAAVPTTADAAVVTQTPEPAPAAQIVPAAEVHSRRARAGK